ncbi:MAG TPA: hypothetical protein DIU05_11830 [Bacteroidetes bacterium]|nr:hypothetical protein [Bacteroidota bacterium]
MRKKVSCHVITYNQKDYISQCIDGILMQKVSFPIEIIIGDDNSIDGTREIVKSYSEKHPDIIRLNLREVKGSGIPGKENFLSTLKMCTGEYISLCDGDDYWTDPLKLQKQVDFLDKNPEYVLCFHPVDIEQSDGTILSDFITKVPHNYEQITTLAEYGNYIHTPSVLFRNILNSLPVGMQHTPIGDYFIYMLLAKHGKIKQLPDTMAVYRRHPGGVHSLTSEEQKVQKWFLMLYYLIPSFNDQIQKILLNRLFSTAETIIIYHNQLNYNTFKLLHNCLSQYKILVFWTLYYKRIERQAKNFVKNRFRLLIKFGNKITS